MSNYKFRPATSRPCRVYRVVVVDPGPQPVVAYDPLSFDPDDEGHEVYTHAGQSRAYLTKRSAERKAEFWSQNGGVVRIDVSEPVVWGGS